MQCIGCFVLTRQATLLVNYRPAAVKDGLNVQALSSMIAALHSLAEVGSTCVRTKFISVLFCRSLFIYTFQRHVLALPLPLHLYHRSTELLIAF